MNIQEKARRYLDKIKKEDKKINAFLYVNEKVVDEVFMESFPERADVKGLRTNKLLYKLRDGEKEELYDITNDINYKNDLSSKNKELCSKFKLKVKNHFKI